MIVRWKKVDALTWASSEWRGMCVIVRWELTRHAWVAVVQAQPGAVLCATGTSEIVISHKWSTAQAAMKAVDAEMEYYIRRKIIAQGGLEVAHA